MSKKNEHLVLSIFASKDAADTAADGLKSWDKANDDVKLGAIGVIYKNADGKVKTNKVGKRAGGKGAKVGVVLGIIAAVLSGGLTLVGGMVYGAIGGGVLGAFFHRSLGMTDADMQNLKTALDGGKAALAVMVDEHEVDATKAQLDSLGGTSESHEVSTEALETVAETAGEEAVETVAESAV